MKVLIAEDHYLTAKLLAKILKDKQQYDVIGIAENGNEVIDIIDKQDVDLILLDINMPYLDGMKTMSMLNESHPGLKFLIISAHTEPWIIKQSLNLGASGYITKNSNPEIVLEAIQYIRNGYPFLDEISLSAVVDDYYDKEKMAHN